MRTRYTAFFLLAAGLSANAQFCTPNFVNGCFNWRLLTVNAGDIAWTYDGIDCLDNDHTAYTTTVDAGTPLNMDVETGVWCGCAVWVDLDNSNSFEDGENLFYAYTGADPSYTYSFSITVPAGTAPGDHRMRIVAPWGSDGFLDTNTNGSGPCGDYQYGNYGDFVVHVSDDSGVGDLSAALPTVQCSPNPAGDRLVISIADGGVIHGVDLIGADGRVVLRPASTASGAVIVLDLRTVPAGMYTAVCPTSSGIRAARVVKE